MTLISDADVNFLSWYFTKFVKILPFIWQINQNLHSIFSFTYNFQIYAKYLIIKVGIRFSLLQELNKQNDYLYGSIILEDILSTKCQSSSFPCHDHSC